MRQGAQMLVGVMGVLLVGGCRTVTRIAEVPRVDLELNSEGNRGYLVGTPPPPGELKTTREMVETSIEIPSFYKPKHSRTPVNLGEAPAPETGPSSQGVVSHGEAAGQKYDTYLVQKGDSLWSIAAKPEIYGKATRWRSILDANRELLKGNPDRIRAGMKLKIPRGGKRREASASSEDEGTTFKK